MIRHQKKIRILFKMTYYGGVTLYAPTEGHARLRFQKLSKDDQRSFAMNSEMEIIGVETLRYGPTPPKGEEPSKAFLKKFKPAKKKKP